MHWFILLNNLKTIKCTKTLSLDLFSYSLDIDSDFCIIAQFYLDIASYWEVLTLQKRFPSLQYLLTVFCAKYCFMLKVKVVPLKLFDKFNQIYLILFIDLYSGIYSLFCLTWKQLNMKWPILWNNLKTMKHVQTLTLE